MYFLKISLECLRYEVEMSRARNPWNDWLIRVVYGNLNQPRFNKSNSPIESTGVRRFALAGSECFQFRSVLRGRQSRNWIYRCAETTVLLLSSLLLRLRRGRCAYLLTWFVNAGSNIPEESFARLWKGLFFPRRRLSDSDHSLLRFL